MKKLWIGFMCVLLVGCSIVKTPEQNPNKPFCGFEDECSKGNADMSDYEGFMETENVFVKSNMQEVLKMIEEGKSAIVYFGFPDCPWCIEALPIMNEVAKTYHQNIYYVQTRDEDRNLIYTEEEKSAILEVVGEFEEKDDDGQIQLFVPLVVVIQDGQAISGNVGTVDGHDAHERKMSEEEKAALTDIYDTMFAMLK